MALTPRKMLRHRHRRLIRPHLLIITDNTYICNIMKKVYKTGFTTKTVTLLSPLLVLLFIGVFIYACVNTSYTGNRLGAILFFGFITLIFLCLSVYCFMEMKDTVTLTDNAIKFHIHRQRFPYSLKTIDDQIRWKDIRDLSLYEPSTHSTVLLLKLNSGEIKEYDIGHMEGMLKYDIKSHIEPEQLYEKAIEADDDLPDDDTGSATDGPGPIAKAKKNTLLWLAGSLIVGIAGTVLIAFDRLPGLGFILVLLCLFAGSLCLFRYYKLISMHIVPKLVSNGHLVTALGAFLLLCLFVAAIFFLIR